MLLTVARTYGGPEGVRVRIGQKLWAGSEKHKDKPAGAIQISQQRARDLIGAGIATLEDVNAGEIAARRVAQASRPTRRVERVRHEVEPPARQAVEPEPPRPLDRAEKAGLTTADLSGSASEEDRQTARSTSTGPKKRRGQRAGEAKPNASESSASTTPGDSGKTATSSTDATSAGGDNTSASSEDTEAIE